MSSFSDPKKIRERIRRYERDLKKRDARNGSGSRYLLGTLYLLLDDTEGALAHYEWFDKQFADDGGEPFHRLGWALVLYRAGRMDEASHRLRNVHFQNVYILPAILGIPHGQPSGLRRWSNWEAEDYITQAPLEFLTLWRPEEKAWLQSVWDSPHFKDFVQAHINLAQQLTHELRGEKRTALVNALHALTHAKI